jgi:hypothetical protein
VGNSGSGSKKRISDLTKIKMLCHSLAQQEKNKAPKQ